METLLTTVYREIFTNNLYGSREQAKTRIKHELDDNYSDYLYNYLASHYTMLELFKLNEKDKKNIIEEVINEVLKEEFEEYQVTIELNE